MQSIPSLAKRLLLTLTVGALLGACSHHPSPRPAKPHTTVVPAKVQPAQVNPNAKVQTAGVERLAFTETYQGPQQGSLESVSALFARGYVDSALRETMLAAVRSDYPMLGMRDVSLSDPVRKFLRSPKAVETAKQYLQAGLAKRMGSPLSEARFAALWQSLPQDGQVRHWSTRIKQWLARG